MKIVILGLSITSSWGNGHATTYRGLVRELTARGHEVLFLERNAPWYSDHRDLSNPYYCQVELYSSLLELQLQYTSSVQQADFVMVGSYVPEGVAVGEWVTTIAARTAFYDIDTPVTLAKLERGEAEYLSPELIPRYNLYLSFTGGSILKQIESLYGSPCAKPFYCSADSQVYYPEDGKKIWDLGYMGTYSSDRQPTLEKLLLEPARQWEMGCFVVAGPQYPEEINWPNSVLRAEHIHPSEHRSFYNLQRFTLNITRADMIRAGYSPSVRLFEAAMCETPIISDYWEGLEEFFEIGKEILIAQTPEDVLRYLRDLSESERLVIAHMARDRVSSNHTSAHRAVQLEGYIAELF